MSDADASRSAQIARSAVRQSINFVPSGTPEPPDAPGSGDQSITPGTASGTTTRGELPPSSSSTIRTDPTQEVEQRVILEKLENILNRFRNGEIKKARTIADISIVLADSEFLSHAEEEATLNTYLAEVDAEAISTLTRTRVTPTRQPGGFAIPLPITTGHRFAEEVGSKGKGRVEEEIFGYSGGASSGDNRGEWRGVGAREPERARVGDDRAGTVDRADGGRAIRVSDRGVEDGDRLERVSRISDRDYGESSSGEESCGGRRKRVRLTEEEMPWFDASRSASRNPSCIKTCELLKLYERDYSRAKFLVKSAPNAPLGFPVSQWDKIFRGEPIDLNQVASALFRPTVAEERTTRVGDAKISLGVAEPTRKVRSQSDWAAAWNSAVKAYRIAFPHRSDELQAYGDYIQGIFTAKDESVHPAVIHFDIGVRNHVGGGQTILLTDTHEFFSLYNAMVMSDGVAFQSRVSTSKRGPAVNAVTSTSVDPVDSVGTDSISAPLASKPWREVFGTRPKFLRHNLWPDPGPTEEPYLSPTVADWSEFATPLPRPPAHVLADPVATKTISGNPDLFKIVTPIDVDAFERLLAHHPNPEFVSSVCSGLREGFWPWADTTLPDYPLTVDLAKTPKDTREANFIREQCHIEVSKGRFSDSFGPDLLPGMYCMPVHAVPKTRANTSELRMVTDHSTGKFSLNSMIDHNCVTGFPLDNLCHFGEMLLHFAHSSCNQQGLTIWKSDVAEAYRLMPVHPYWQIKQINTVDGLRYVDRCNAFGTSSSAAIWISFNSLVAWIAKHKRGLDYLATYVDDSSGFDVRGDKLFYGPYGEPFPRHQTILLQLWDDLRIPHKRAKQLFSDESLPIIGITVDPNGFIFSLPSEAKENLLEALTTWYSRPVNASKQAYRMRYWKQLAGWINWAFNVFPLLRPCLNCFYSKIAGPYDPGKKILLNNDIREDLSWAAYHIRHSDGIHLLRSREWDPLLADCTIYCDASLSGMGFWYPDSKTGFYASTPDNTPASLIFFFEALTVYCALRNAASREHKGGRIVIYTDNYNTVQIFNSLRCDDKYNIILKSSVDILIDSQIDLRVLHIPGDSNVVADSLSRFQFQNAIDIVPELSISPFQPPLWSLGAAYI
ncbi:hypothetical protein CVT26_010234 [Gymnopilus dilepis]|uniref:Reverse transcriptase domain-containing protein n=1 Tax=Gymnopilus dilepis TaxID=231916 RepID=A0A409Y173_9AGAR|nr:hypothetical protein CVT26_010234 [Gymnopilus dilepis]